MAQLKWRMENLGELVQAGIKTRDAMELQKIARQVHRLDEHSCNYGLSEAQEKREENLEKKAESIADQYGRKVYWQGDPRGWPMYLYNPEEVSPQEIASRYDQRGLAVCPH